MAVDKYTLHKDQKSEKWRLEKEGSDRAKRTFDSKSEAMKNLRAAVGPGGGSVRIRKITLSRRNGPIHAAKIRRAAPAEPKSPATPYQDATDGFRQPPNLARTVATGAEQTLCA